MNYGIITMERNVLQHYGVKGMKWGVRKTKEQIRIDRVIARGKAHANKYLRNKDGSLIVTDDWKNEEHPHIPTKMRPYAVLETISGKHRQINRTIYNGKGFVITTAKGL